jgi:hypothetical protein
MSEGISSPDSFSRLLRKLAKGDLLVESFSARLRYYFNSGKDPEVHARHRKHTMHIHQIMSISYLIVSAMVIVDVAQASIAEEALQGSETLRD